MRAKTILALILGVFVVVAIVTVGRQSAPSAARTDRPVVASAVPLAEATPEAPIKTATTAAVVSEPSSVVAASAPPDAKPRATGRTRASSGAVAEVKAVPVAEPRQAATPPTHVRKVIATYFHGNVRCVTCRKIEAQAQEAVQDAFGEQIAAGSVEFRAVNVEENANRHFIQDYQLVTKTLVITEEMDGKVARWAKLDNVWTLVNDRAGFYRYVQGGVRDYLETQ